jgi:hypothetical protein
MNPTIDLDDKIRDLLDQLDHATPTPPAFDELHHYGHSGPSRMVPLTAAAAVVAIGVGGLVAITARNDGSATQPAAPPAASQPAPSESQPAPASASGPLLSTPLDATSAPFVVLDQPGWPLTAAFGQVSSPLSGGFEGSTVLIGDGPMYDAPLFAATVVETVGADTTTQVTVPSASTLLEMGDPIEVAGTTGSIEVTETDEDSGLDGPVVVMFWPLDDGHVARVNSVRLTVDEAVAMANQLSLVDGSLTMTTPDGYRTLDTPLGGDRRYVSYRWANGGAELELNAENRGVSSLLGRLAGEVRTTRVVIGTEVAYRPQPTRPGEYWVDWQTGDWSYYVIASGFPDEDGFFAALSSLTLTDPATFEATGADIGIVMPGEHHELADQVLSQVGLTEDALQQAATTEVPMSLDSYAFDLFRGATCVWSSDWTNAVTTGDQAAQAELATAVAATIAAANGTGFERAATVNAEPLLRTINGEAPTTDIDYTTECPDWALTS